MLPISKVYFPCLIVLTATVVTAFVDFLISFVILIGMMLYYRYAPGRQMLLLPLFILLALLASLGPGPVDHGAQRQVPRFPRGDPFRRAVRALRLAGRLQQQRHP